METQQPANSIEKALQQWQQRENRFSQLFGNDMASNTSLLKLKLKDLDLLQAQYRNSAVKSELFSLTIVEHERRRIERELYPNTLVRLFRRLLVSPIVTQKQLVTAQKQTESDRLDLIRQLQKHGFGKEEIKAVLAEVDRGEPPYSIPVSYFVNDHQRLDQELMISRNEDGRHQLDGFVATLHHTAEPDRKRSHHFKITEGAESFTAAEIKNLLTGRALLKNDRWIQFDLNDRDTGGSYRLKEFRYDYGYDLPGVIQQIGLDASRNQGVDAIRSGLEKGEQVFVSVEKGGKEIAYTIEANPQFKTLNAYDSKQKQVELNTLKSQTGQKQTQVVKVVQETPAKSRQMRVVK